MKRPFVKKLISTVLVLLLVVTYGGAFVTQSQVVYGVTSDDLSDAKDKQDDLQSELDKTKSEIAQLQQDSSDTQSYIEQLDAKVAELDNSIYTTGLQIDDLEAKIEDTENKLAEAEVVADQQYESMKLRIQFMYEYNSENYITVLLSASSMGDLLNRAEYISKISQYDREMLLEYQENIEFIANAKSELESDHAEMETMMASLEEQKEAAEYAQQVKVAQLQKLNTQLTSAQTKEDQLHTDLAAQESTITAMEAQIKAQEEAAKQAAANAANSSTGSSSSSSSGTSTGTNTSTSTGQFIWPTVSHRITSPYGDTEDRSSAHAGVDIGAVTAGVSGDPIYAADGGQVTIATYSSSAGNWIWIYHGDGLYTVYMHCSSLLVSVGQTVTRGQTIALMGTTGNSTGVHLHFGVRLNGSYVNPMSYIN